MPNALCLRCIRCECPKITTLWSRSNKVLRFGIEFAPAVVRADGNVRNMAWRICNAKKVLVRLDSPIGEQ